MSVNPRIRRRRSNERRAWPAARPNPSGQKPARRRRQSPPPVAPEDVRDSGLAPGLSLDEILERFTESWDRGEGPRAEGYVGLLPPGDLSELVYREFCLAEESGQGPDPADYLRRFPDQAESLRRLFSLHGAVTASCLRSWVEPGDLPEAGDEIGPYRLLRELGRGAFARVFLAEQADLGDRLVVVKASSRPSAEPTLLARARHAHIVEVLRQAEADSESGKLHLICMSFLGGATLGDVLESRRKLARRAHSGLDLLADLDRASAPEYPESDIPRPAREILARLSHPGAVAWIGARLAQALDHAQARGVTHGDLKPSNILLTAEGMPMLFDFNLAVDGAEAGGGQAPAELGGTLAYMAPERLLAIAAGPGAEARSPRAPGRHRADIYALGLVLLEALTGRPPAVPPRRPGDARGVASATAELRRGLPDTLRAAPIPSALRSILGRCLAHDPADRYTRGAELARDLDLWRADKPPVFADEPRRSAIVRRLRRGRRILIGASATLAAASIAGLIGLFAIDRSDRDKAADKYATILDRADSGAFPFRKFGQWRLDDSDDPAELAGRQLERYGVASDPDWADREDIRSLPAAEREELEAWLLEQVLRRAVALADRPDSPGDWARAEALLAMTVSRHRLSPLLDLRTTLRARLKLPPSAPLAAGPPPAPGWLASYLAGVAAEPLHAREALGHYREALKGRPGLFWAHYRSATVACRIDEYPEAAEHLRFCVDRRPRNPALHAHLAAVLFRVERDTEPGQDSRWPVGSALAESEKALEIDPDFSQAIFTRALIHRASGRAEGVRSDIGRFALLTRARGDAPALTLQMRSRFHYGPNSETQTDNDRSLARQILAQDPRDRETRAFLASGLAHLGENKAALEEFEKVIEADPDHLRARYLRAVQLDRVESPAAIAEFAALIDHPRFEEVFREQPTALRAFHYVATDLLDRGRCDEALAVAERALIHANRSGSFRNETMLARRKISDVLPLSPRGETYYLMARIHAKASADPGGGDHLDRAVDCLDRAFACSRQFRVKWFAADARFDALRGEILARLDTRPVDR